MDTIIAILIGFAIGVISVGLAIELGIKKQTTNNPHHDQPINGVSTK